MVKSHPANHTVPMKVCCSIRIFCIPSPRVSVPKVPSAAVSSKQAFGPAAL